MIKLGTIFSGIGAIEHAIERMGLPVSIEFAIDNGDVDILSKNIEYNIPSIVEEIQLLKDMYNRNTELDWLDDELELADAQLKEIESYLDEQKINSDNVLSKVFLYLGSEYPNQNQQKAYDKILTDLENSQSTHDKLLQLVHMVIKFEADVRRMTGKNIKDTIFYFNEVEDLTKFKTIKSLVRSLVSDLSMLHEKINTEDIRQKVFSMDNLKEQKSYVDNIYKDHVGRNKVRESYLANYDIKEDNFHWNASFFDGTHFNDQIDLLVGGSPCQSFSLVGHQKGLDDTRGTLFYEFARIVEEVQPKVFIFENVKAILSNDEGRTWETMKRVFSELGYDWKFDTLNAKDYGVPQNRERVFVVGFRKDLKVDNFNFPEKQELKVKMQDYLIDNVSGKYYLSEKGVKFVTSEKNLNKQFTQIDGEIQLCQKKNQQFNWHGDFVFVEENSNKEGLLEDLDKYFLSEKVEKYVMSSGTKGFYSKPEINLDVARPLLNTMHKMHRAGVDNYVTTQGRIRKLTPRECLRLMGFCDSFKIGVSDTSMYQQAGNSIVVDVLIAILDEIIKAYPQLIEGNVELVSNRNK